MPYIVPYVGRRRSRSPRSSIRIASASESPADALQHLADERDLLGRPIEGVVEGEAGKAGVEERLHPRCRLLGRAALDVWPALGRHPLEDGRLGRVVAGD